MNKILQHVIDPQNCIGCSACEMACQNKAITSIAGRFCIDFASCNNCGKCISDCPTGACSIHIETEKIYSIDEQSCWTCLPNQDL